MPADGLGEQLRCGNLRTLFALGEQGGRDAGEDIAAAAAGQRRSAGKAVGAGFGGKDLRVGTLERECRNRVFFQKRFRSGKVAAETEKFTRVRQ